MNLRENLDRDLTVMPSDPFDLVATLAEGRRSVRRRRAVIALSGAAASTVLAAALTTALTVGGGAPDSNRVAGSTDACADWQAVVPASCEPGIALDGNVDLLQDGPLVVSSGWRVVERVDNPTGTVESVAVAVTDGSSSEWALMKYPDADGGFAMRANPEDYPSSVTFADWLDYAQSRWLGTGTTSIATFNEAGGLVAKPGWPIAQHASGLTMPTGYRGPDGVTAVMQLAESKTWFIVRPTPDGAEAFPVVPWNQEMDDSVAGVLAYVSSPGYVQSEQGMVREKR